MTDDQQIYLGIEVWRGHPVPRLKHYQVSSHGRIRNTRTDKFMKLVPNDAGYLRVRFYDSVSGNKPTHRVNRLVAIAFIPNPYDLPEVHHEDHDTTNNCVLNLQWCTRQENIDYRYSEDR